jgi:ABC-type branched-subunit amino acid transport system ATPase component/ABC-type branched-subunit amino acid transport system permease subunit
VAIPQNPIWRRQARVTIRNFIIALALAFVAALPYLGILPGWTPSLATLTAFISVSLVGLNLIFGVTGMLSLGQAAFVVIPGYFAGILHSLGVPALAAIPVGILASIVIARLVAEIFIRLPGIYFAIGTLGFAFVVEGLARAFPGVTGGASGLVLESPVNLTRNQWYVLSVVALALALISFAWLVRGRFLRTLRLVRHDELAAQVLGIDVVKVKTQVFTIGSAYSAAGGILSAYYVSVLAPESGGVNASLEALAMLVIGGSGALFGPLLGAAAIQWLFAIAGEAKRYELLVYGAGFFFVVLYAPIGIAGLLRRAWPAPSEHLAGHLSNASAPRSDAEWRGSTPVAAESTSGRQNVCLQVENVSKHFGGLKAVADVSFQVRSGQIVALIGPNGAGKSTLFNVVSGIESPTQGRVLLDGKDLTNLTIHERAVSIGRSFQVPRLIPDLTALDNVLSRLDHLPGARNEVLGVNTARSQLETFGLGNLADIPANRIGLGQHKLIEIVRAAIGNPPLLLLDEPAVGLTPEEVARLANLLRVLRSRGTAILVVEHNVGFVATVADEVVVMETGRLIAAGSPQAVMADQKVKDAYLGALA